MVLLLVSESWVISAAMKRKVEVTYTGFLQQITGKRERKNPDETWVTLVVGEVMGEAGMQLAATYIGRRQGTVDQWVALRRIFEV